jgi:hypothetical protein
MRTSGPALLLSLALFALPSHLPADALRDTARVVATTRRTLYLDAGASQGLREGMRWTTTLAGQPVTVRVIAVSGATAVVALEGAAAPVAVGAELALPPGRTTPRPGPSRRPAPRPSAPWVPELAADALPHIGLDDGADVVTSASRRRTELLAHGEVAAYAAVGADLGGQSRSHEDVGITNDLSLAYGAWTWDHLFDLHYAARPELISAPLQNGALRFDVVLARLGWTSTSESLSANLGRMSAAEGTSAGMVDGGRIALVAAPNVELGAWAGARPDMLDLSPEVRAPSAGLVARLGARRPAQLAARADVALAADAWRGSLDRAFANARVGLDLPWHASLEGEAIVDLANDADDQSAARVSRATATARARFVEGAIDARVHGGLEDPVLTRSLADRLDLAAPFVTTERHWYGLASVDVHLVRGLLLDARVRADDGDDDFWSLSGDAGVRVLDVGPLGSEAWLRGQAMSGTVLEGVGGEIGWLAPLSFAHVDLSYALDRWLVGPSGEPATAHRGRLAIQRRIGERWRTTLSLEAATGAGPLRAFAYLLVGYRI